MMQSQVLLVSMNAIDDVSDRLVWSINRIDAVNGISICNASSHQRSNKVPSCLVL